MEDRPIARSAHNVDDVWTQVQEDRRLSLDTRERVSSIEAKLDNLLSSINGLADKIYNKPQTNWIGLGSLLLALMIAFGTYLDTRLTPTETSVTSYATMLYQHNTQISSVVQSERYISEELNRLKNNAESMSDRIGRLEGKQ